MSGRRQACLAVCATSAPGDIQDNAAFELAAVAAAGRRPDTRASALEVRTVFLEWRASSLEAERLAAKLRAEGFAVRVVPEDGGAR